MYVLMADCNRRILRIIYNIQDTNCKDERESMASFYVLNCHETEGCCNL